MNQIGRYYVLNDGDIKNKVCIDQSNIYLEALRNFEPWALKSNNLLIVQLSLN